MRHFIFLLTVCVSLTSFSQDSAIRVPKTDLERVNMQVGTIIRKEFIDLYTFKEKGFLGDEKLKARVLKIRDAATGIQTTGILFRTYQPGSTYTSSKTSTAYLDEEEIPALLKFLEFAAGVKDKTEPNYTEYLFNSKDLQFFVYYSQGLKNTWQWHYGISADRFYSGSQVFFDEKVFSELKAPIEASEDLKH